METIKADAEALAIVLGSVVGMFIAAFGIVAVFRALGI